MDFADYRKMAEIWVGSQQQTPVQLLFADEDDCHLVFTVGTDENNISFNVGCPRGNTRRKFKVWSDNEQTAVQLYHMQDYLDSCREKTLKEILDKALKTLEPLLRIQGAAAPVGSDDEEGFEQADDDGFNEEDDDDDDGYYEEPEMFAEEQAEAVRPNNEQAVVDPVDVALRNQYDKGRGSRSSVHRLLADLKQIKNCGNKFGFEGEPRDDNLFIWDVKLIDFDKKSRLGKDLAKYADKYKQEPNIHLEIKFPETYPMSPPFLRVIRPRFKFLTGHITIGGSICMELLTTSGWRPTNDVEGILVQVRSEIMSDPNAQLDDINANKVYSEDEARMAFSRMVQRYGWNK